MSTKGPLLWDECKKQVSLANHFVDSNRFGLLGIPALVVLDTISGNIVASTEESRPEVGRACQMGNDGIESLFSRWIDQIPEDSKVCKRMISFVLCASFQYLMNFIINRQ